MGKRKAKLASGEEASKKNKLEPAPEQVANTDWSIDDYRTRYEPEEHWDLRRCFMEAHQNWIPEDELVCLAQVFVNVELLHCRYPLETMERLKELSKGIADEFRASRKNKLQRTFVSASDAAASKVQGKGPVQQVPKKGGPIQFKAASSRTFKPVKPMRTLEDVYNNVVLMNNDFEQTMIEFNRWGCGQMQLVGSKESGKFCCEIVVASKFSLAKAVENTEKTARKNVKLLFMEKLSEHCYKIHRTKQSVDLAKSSVERKAVEATVNHRGQKIVEDFKEKKIDSSNLGFKLLQKLGWSGGSLGSKNEGIVDPINCQIKIGRQGLGVAPAVQGANKKKGMIDTRKETYAIDVSFYRQTMQNFRDSGIDYDLVFSNEFTKEERALFHTMAQKLHLKTRSFGKDEDGTRQFVLLGKKLSPHEMLERIIEEKDPIFCEMYSVEPPKSNKQDQ